MKMLNSNPAYDNHYHFTASTKYRFSMLADEGKRERLKEIVQDMVERMPGTELICMEVMHDHMHLLIRTTSDPSYVGGRIFGASSRYMRLEFADLRKWDKPGKGGSLWGGTSCNPLQDAGHLRKCVAYIKNQRDHHRCL